jgi:hypothetical protein
MTHQRITRLCLGAGADWSRARERLAARAASDAASGSLRLVRVDDTHAVLLVAAADRDELARIDDVVVAPWLAELPLAEAPTTVVGDVAFDSADATSSVDALDGPARIDHFVQHAIEARAVWSLYGERWARSDAAGDREALPLWPDRELAARCIAGRWATFAPRAIELTAFLDQWLSGMQEDGIAAVLTPTPADPGTIVEPDVLARALRDAGAK